MLLASQCDLSTCKDGWEISLKLQLVFAQRSRLSQSTSDEITTQRFLQSNCFQPQ